MYSEIHLVHKTFKTWYEYGLPKVNVYVVMLIQSKIYLWNNTFTGRILFINYSLSQTSERKCIMFYWKYAMNNWKGAKYANAYIPLLIRHLIAIIHQKCLNGCFDRNIF